MKRLSAITAILLLAGCAARDVGSIQPRSLGENGILMSEPTPSNWEIGSEWNFVKYGKDGVAVLDVTFRVTDNPARTCSSGDWRELDIVDGQIGTGSIQLKQSYSVSGRLLTIDLTGWCDVGAIQGALSEESFAGQTTGGPFTRGKFVPQRVVGRRLR
jgi:hypothetical protein